MKLNKKQGNIFLAVLVIAFFGLALAFPNDLQNFFGAITGSIVGSPFAIETFSTEWYPSCAFRNCCNPYPPGMEGFADFAEARAVFRSTPFAETDLGQNYNIRAVSCETGPTGGAFNGYVLGANTREYGPSSIHFVSQVQTKDGKWLDYYVSSGNYDDRGTKLGDIKHDRIQTVYQIPNSNEYTYHNSGIGVAIDLPESIESNKVRCRFESSWQVPRYGGGIKVNVGYLKIYGTVVEPTCFDSIKNQDETEIDYGGVCGVEEEIPVVTEVCGNNFCGENESSESCPTDCAVIELEPSQEQEPTGTNIEEVPGVGLVVVGNTFPEGFKASDALIPMLLIGIVVLGIGVAWMVFRK